MEYRKYIPSLSVALVCVAGTAIPVDIASDDDVAINCCK